MRLAISGSSQNLYFPKKIEKTAKKGYAKFSSESAKRVKILYFIDKNNSKYIVLPKKLKKITYESSLIEWKCYLGPGTESVFFNFFHQILHANF
jgi:hypothetical protein